MALFYGFGYDPTYILVIIGIVLSLLASSLVKSSYNKYSKVRSKLGISGRETAERLLRREGIYDVSIERVSGNLSDHYDPRSKTLRLSQSVHDGTSVASIGVAAHECGHAIQDYKKYAPLKFRASMVPVANIGSTLSWPFVIVGLTIGTGGMLLINIGIWLFTLAVLFQVITLPVEFNASRRALRAVENNGILYPDEMKGAKKVLSAAALTYIAAAATAILQLLRLVMLSGGRRRG